MLLPTNYSGLNDTKILFNKTRKIVFYQELYNDKPYSSHYIYFARRKINGIGIITIRKFLLFKSRLRKIV